MANVSWLIPVKNGMPFLPETLASLEAQTYKDFQVLVWDNGSTDGTVEELRKWIPHRLCGQMVTDKPRTVGGSRAGLVEMAETEICAFIDADDICQPDRLERQLNFLETHPNIALVGSQLRVIDETSRPTGTIFQYPLAHDDIVHALLTGNPIGNPSVVFRRSAVLAVGNFDPEAPYFEDYELWFRLGQRYEIANLPDALVNYRFHWASATRTVEKEQKSTAAYLRPFIKHAPVLFGITPAEAERLRNKRDLFVIARAVKIARHLARTQGGSTWSRLRSPSLLDNLRPLTRSRDVVTRLCFALVDPRAGAVSRELRVYMGWGLRKAPFGARLMESTSTWKRTRRFRNWREMLSAHGCNITQRINFTGDPEGYRIINTATGLWIEPEVTIWVSRDRGAQPSLTFGKKVFVGRHTYLGVYLPISIGDHTIIGAYSYIISANHCFESREIPIQDQGFQGAPITIGEDVWIGTHVVILPGVTIGKGAIIAAGSIVNRNVPAYQIWGGVPARFIKERPE